MVHEINGSQNQNTNLVTIGASILSDRLNQTDAFPDNNNLIFGNYCDNPKPMFRFSIPHTS